MDNRPLEERFWEKVKKGDGCWLWAGATQGGGYGQIILHGKKLRTHRVSWEMANGPIPTGMLVCHHCDKPRCVRPDHLFLGTVADNNRDCLKKGRSGRHTRPERFPRGEKSPHAKLRADDIHQIRSMHNSGMTCITIADHYPVHSQTVSKIIRRVKWAHIK